MRTVVQSDVKLMNKRMVFNLLRKYKQCTRTEISQALNMSMPSVSKIIDDFLEKDIVISAGEVESPMGRKPLNLAFNPDVFSAIGVEFEGNRLSIGLVNLEGKVKYKTAVNFCHAFDDAFADTVTQAVQYIMKSNAETTIVGIGIGVPGVVNISGNAIEFAPLIGINETADVRDVLEKIQKATQLPTLLENDTNSAAIGEMYARELGKQEDLVFINIGTGLGAGVILNGKLRRGAGNMCGEIGYIVEESGWPTDRGRTGFLEGLLNTDALKRQFDFSAHKTAEHSAVIRYIVCHLSKHIANIVALLDARLVVLGGMLVDIIEGSLAQELNTAVNLLSVSPVRVEKYIAEEPGIAGTALLMLENKLNELL